MSNTVSIWKAHLKQEAQEHCQVILDDDQIQSLWMYCDLLQRFHKTMNLSSITDWYGMRVKHVLDSLSIAPFLQPGSTADIGSGAGLPGIPLAVAFPDSTFTLVEVRKKRAHFLKYVIQRLGLKNVEVLQIRVEDLQDGAVFDNVISRAFSSAQHFLEVSGCLCHENGLMITLKNEVPDETLVDLPSPFFVKGVYPYTLPGVAQPRHVVVFARQI